MELLDKARKMYKLLNKSERIRFDRLADILSSLVEANIYVTNLKGQTLAYATCYEYESDRLYDNVLQNQQLPPAYNQYLLSARESRINLTNTENNFADLAPIDETLKKQTSIIPIYGKGGRIGTLLAEKFGDTLTTDELLLAEYAATILGIEMAHMIDAEKKSDDNDQSIVQRALDSMSLLEITALVKILSNVEGTEGVLIASKIADEAGITRSVIANALRKFESAGLLETKSLGTRGTYIRILNSMVLTMLNIPK